MFSFILMNLLHSFHTKIYKLLVEGKKNKKSRIFMQTIEYKKNRFFFYTIKKSKQKKIYFREIFWLLSHIPLASETPNKKINLGLKLLASEIPH